MYSKNAKKPTKAEAARMARLKQMPCVAGDCTQCAIEVHHLLSGGKRRGHMFTIPLCAWHHRGVQLGGLSRTTLEHLLGPSLAHGSKPFHAAFGEDDYLLATTNKLLGEIQ